MESGLETWIFGNWYFWKTTIFKKGTSWTITRGLRIVSSICMESAAGMRSRQEIANPEKFVEMYFFPIRSSLIATQIHIEQSSMNFIEDNMTKIFDIARFSRSFVTLFRGALFNIYAEFCFHRVSYLRKNEEKTREKKGLIKGILMFCH